MTTNEALNEALLLVRNRETKKILLSIQNSVFYGTISRKQRIAVWTIRHRLIKEKNS